MTDEDARWHVTKTLASIIGLFGWQLSRQQYILRRGSIARAVASLPIVIVVAGPGHGNSALPVPSGRH